MNQQRILSDRESFALVYGFCGSVCDLSKPYCAGCLFDYCSNKHKIGIILDSDLMFMNEIGICGLLDIENFNKVYKYNFDLWLYCVDDLFIGVNEWLLENWDVARENYFDMLSGLND